MFEAPLFFGTTDEVTEILRNPKWSVGGWVISIEVVENKEISGDVVEFKNHRWSNRNLMEPQMM